MATKKRKKEDIFEKLLKKADEAKKAGLELGKVATTKAKKGGKKIKEEGQQKISQGMYSAKKFTNSSQEDLLLLERLAEMKKNGIITEKEFQLKKKEILKRI